MLLYQPQHMCWQQRVVKERREHFLFEDTSLGQTHNNSYPK